MGGENAHQNPLFMKTNYILAAAWGTLYVLTAIWTFLFKKAGFGNVLILVNNLIPILMGLFTAWFEKWYPARMARENSIFSCLLLFSTVISLILCFMRSDYRYIG